MNEHKYKYEPFKIHGFFFEGNHHLYSCACLIRIVVVYLAAPAPLSIAATVAISVVITFIVSVVIGFLAGLLVMYLCMHKKAVYSPTAEGQANVGPTAPAGPEEVSPKEEIELNTKH